MKNEKKIQFIKTFIWSFKLAWRINKLMLLFWLGLNIILSILPAITLFFNRAIIADLSSFIKTSAGGYADVVTSIVILGLLLTIGGLSARMNRDFLFVLMFDYYQVGLQEILVTRAQNYDLSTLFESKTLDEYHWVMKQGYALTNFMSSICLLIGEFAAIISLLVVAYTVSLILFIISLVYYLLIVFYNAFALENNRYNYQKTMKQVRKADYLEKLTQNPGTAKEIRIYNNSSVIVKLWEETIKKVDSMELKRHLTAALRVLMSTIGYYIFMVAMIVYSIYLVAGQKIGPDIFLIVYMLSTNISRGITGMSDAFRSLDFGMFALDRQRKFFEQIPVIDSSESIHDTPLDPNVCFELENVSFEYKSGTPVLCDVNLKFYKGQTVAIVGLNGSGKTTLVKLLLGLYQPTAGKIKFFGREYKKYKRGYIASKIGVFFQDFFIFHLSIGENVGIGDIKNVDNEELVRTAIREGGADKVLSKMPNGLKARLQKLIYPDGVILSGGEGQRVGVSRAHMSSKDIMIFDEPASMLDPIAEMEQFEKIRKKAVGKTFVLISHRIGFARLADRILVLDKNRIVEDGSHEELMQKNGVYSNMFREQAQWYDIAGVKK